MASLRGGVRFTHWLRASSTSSSTAITTNHTARAAAGHHLNAPNNIMTNTSGSNFSRRSFHSSTPQQETFPVLLPALSPTMTEGTIVSWLVTEGQEVAVGDTLFEMETDKAIMSVDSTEDGYLAKILIPEGTSGIAINKLCGLMVEEEGEEPEMPEETTPAAATPEPVAAAPTQTPTPTPTPTPAQPIETVRSGKTAKPLSPAVLAMVNKLQLDASLIPATGPKGHILKGDVLAYLDGDVVVTKPKAEKKKAPAPAQPTKDPKITYVDVPTTNIRKVIARRLTESKSTIPHAYSSIEVDMGKIAALRAEAKEQGIKFSFNDAIIKSAALALRTMPAVNAAFTPNGVERHNTVDISVAVATPTGLITPIVTGADGRGMTDISATIKELAGRAREGKLQPHEYQGGTFSVSNLGMMGVASFSAVINPPQACILAVGATQPKINLDFTVSQVATFTLSSDARVCDDEDASIWLSKFKTFMENPATLL